MDAKDIQKRITRLKDDIEREVRDRLPRKVGVVAVNHFKQNFRDAGWRDDGLHPWKTTRRQKEGGPDAKYTPLTSRRDHLMRSIQYESQPGQVTVSNPVPYAAIHNEGGTVNTHPSVTKHMHGLRSMRSLASRARVSSPSSCLQRLPNGGRSHSQKNLS